MPNGEKINLCEYEYDSEGNIKYMENSKGEMNELQEYKLLNQITQKELAEKLGLTESKVSRLMRVESSLKDILTYSEYQEMMQRLE